MLYLLPFIQLFADVTPLIEVRETLRNGQEPAQWRQDLVYLRRQVNTNGQFSVTSGTYYILWTTLACDS